MAEENNEKFKLTTRRYLAWGAGGLFCLIIGFVAVWGAISGINEYVTMAVGVASASIGGILGYYFGKKTSEE